MWSRRGRRRWWSCVGCCGRGGGGRGGRDRGGVGGERMGVKSKGGRGRGRREGGFIRSGSPRPRRLPPLRVVQRLLQPRSVPLRWLCSRTTQSSPARCAPQGQRYGARNVKRISVRNARSTTSRFMIACPVPCTLASWTPP